MAMIRRKLKALSKIVNFYIVIYLLVSISFQASLGQENGHYTSYAIIRGINKITGKNLILKIPVDNELHYFERLGFFVSKCWKVEENQAPENKALIQIWHKNTNGNTERIFHGWMFSSFSSLSSMEHPNYDLALLDCVD